MTSCGASTPSKLCSTRTSVVGAIESERPSRSRRLSRAVPWIGDLVALVTTSPTRVAAFPEIDFSKIYRYEEEDLTNAAQELASQDGMAISTRMRTGRTVHSTSSTVLCVVIEGTGFRFSLKRGR